MAIAAILPPAPSSERRDFFAHGMLVICAIAVAKLLFHIYFNNRYGYFRDEFDYMSCGDHLGWGYVDQPPLIPFLIHICRAVLGDSLRSVRFIPALASSVLVIQAAVIARELGGKVFALSLAAVTIVIAPQYLSNGSLLGTNCLEPNLWMGCTYFAVLAIKRNDPRYWLLFGVVAGIGMEEKYTIALFCFGMVVGLLLTEHRRVFLNQWIWLGGLVAILIFLPNLLWNIHYDFPFLQLMHHIRAAGRDVLLSPSEYFVQQTLLVHPLGALVWLTGLAALFFSPRFKPYRPLAWTYVVCYLVLSALHGKNYYLAPIYPMLLAAGAVVFETATAQHNRLWLRPAFIVLLLAAGAFFAPIVIPIFSPEHFLAYEKYLPMKLPVLEHGHERAILPQWYADQFGWQEIVEESAVAWNRIPPAERSACGIFAQNYGQAGAIDFFGPRYGLPRALSGHQTFYLWGPRGYSGNCMIVLDDDRETLEKLWQHVEYVGSSPDNRYALERNIPVFICTGAKFGTLADLWPKVKSWS